MKFISFLITIALIFAFGNITLFAYAEKAPRILPSTIFADLQTKKKQNPKITNKEFAAYANKLLAEKGFNYNFGISELFNQKSSQKEFPDTQKEHIINFPFEFILSDKSKRIFDLTAKKNLMNQCYDESSPAFPITQANKNEVSVIVEGKPVKVKMPKEFIVMTASLVDTKTKKKILQNWVLPAQIGLSDYNFVGISADYTKLYLKVQDNYIIYDEDSPEIKELALEISSDGKIRFVPKSSVSKKFRWEYLNNRTEINDVLAKVTIAGKVLIFAVPDASC